MCGNGVRIVHEKMDHVRSVALGVWIEAGSANELEGEEGIAHFIEHMLFKGTDSRTARMIAEEFDGIGGDINAFTSKEMTCYYATVLNNHAGKALAILADMLFNSLFDEVEMTKEKSVILEEVAVVEDTPDDDVMEQLWTNMYLNQPIGRPILGNKETIAKFDKKAIVHFMKRLYRPERIVISVAGNYDAGLIQLIEDYFGSFTASKLNKESIVQVPKFHSGITVKEKETEQAHIGIGFPGLATKDKRMSDLVILDSIIGGSMSSRLFQEVREERGLAYAIDSFYSSYSNGGSFIIYGGTSPEKAIELYSTINSVINLFLKEGVKEKEIQNAKEQVKGGFILGLESSESRMYRNGNNELMLRSHRSVNEVISRIDAVTKESVQEIGAYIFQGNRATSVILPEGMFTSQDFDC